MTSNPVILLDHGAGGKMSQQLLDEIILPNLMPKTVDQQTEQAAVQEDATFLDLPPGRPFFSTDSYIVSPYFFPGGNIGELAINGTVNDLAMRGAMVTALSVAFILEEGLAMEDLVKITQSMGRAAAQAGAKIICGDTKVTPRGTADKIFINTTGVGVAKATTPDIHAAGAQEGDVVIVSGSLGDHGAAILLARENLGFSSPVKSDTAALNGLVRKLLSAGLNLHVLRDPTRGGLAASLTEIAQASQVTIQIEENQLPLKPAVASILETLGIDPLIVANEGKMMLILPAAEAEQALTLLQAHPLGRDAAIIGQLVAGEPGRVTLTSMVGGTRIIRPPSGELLPRIC